MNLSHLWVPTNAPGALAIRTFDKEQTLALQHPSCPHTFIEGAREAHFLAVFATRTRPAVTVAGRQAWQVSSCKICLGNHLVKPHAALMISTEQTIEHYRCPTCKMWYRVRRERVIEYQTGSFNCIECKVEVISWIGVFGYSNWTAVGAPTAVRKPSRYAF